MGPPVGIDRLPSELLHRIFEYVHGFEVSKDTSGNLCNSLVVCRKWQAQARLVLYRSIRLDFDKLGRFLEAFDHDAIFHVTYKMHIRLCGRDEYPDIASTPRFEGCMDPWLRRLAQDVLPHMRQLYRFALAPFEMPLAVTAVGVQKTTLVAVLGALPTSCKNLTLRVCVEGERHVCGTIRDLLPRMDRVYLYLSLVCYSILGEYSGRGFHLNSLPKNLWLLISWKSRGSEAQTCPESHWEGPISPRDSLLRAVRHTVHGSMEAAVTLIPGLGRLDYHVGRDRLS